MKHRLFLLRAYGDASIALYFLANSPLKNEFKVIASSHLKPLISALSNYIHIGSLDIEYIHLGINKSQLNLFTNRHFISMDTLTQVKKIKQFLMLNPNPIGLDYMEQSNKLNILNFLLRKDFKAIVNDKNVYDEMQHFFNTPLILQNAADPIKNILILPDARIANRKIPMAVIEYLKTSLTQKNKLVTQAYFSSHKNVDQDTKNYSNFDELLTLIKEADFVFGSDSLGIHLSNALQKPHCILYPKNGSKAFFTPFSIEHKCFATFDNVTSIQIPI